jgi:hypothetical protein
VTGLVSVVAAAAGGATGAWAPRRAERARAATPMAAAVRILSVFVITIGLLLIEAA